jgi:hypothetical protein
MAADIGRRALGNARRTLALRGIDGTRQDLVEEFIARPSGAHTSDLFFLLVVMRSQRAANKHFLYMLEPHESWELAMLGDDATFGPVTRTGVVFTDLEEAERHVFRLRWEQLFPESAAAGSHS